MLVISEKTNMNIVAKSDLNFHGIQLQPVANLDGVWLTASQIGFALEYADDKAVQRIYTRHADEFTQQMTGVVKVTTPYGEQMTRAFSLRGAHLIAMFARTSVAKEFRRWVLDILDREVAVNMPISSAPSERERHAYNVDALAYHYEFMYEAWKRQIEPALRAIESPLAGRLHDRFQDGKAFMRLIKEGSEKQLKKGEVARLY
ncbi:Bro-N domain-containing protein [Pantoea agglomerans]|nr:Bro-N domain-containing protein [Pantoea agglomerans]